MGRPGDNSLPSLLYRRQLGCRRLHPLTVNLRIVRSLLRSTNREHRCIGIVKSKQPITYNAARIFTSSFTTCRTMVAAGFQAGSSGGANSFPLLYRLPVAPGGKLNDAMLYAIPYSWIPPKESDAEPSLLRLTDCYLERRNLDSGQFLESFPLGPDARFKYLSWNEPCHSILLKSKKFIHKNENREQITSIHFLLFDVAPMRPTVAVTFCSDLFRVKDEPLIREFDVNIDNFLLIVTANKFVLLYSFKALVEQNPPEPSSPLLTTQGYRNNVRIKKLPPQLLRVKSKQPENMTFGGFPLHVLYMTEEGCMHLQRVGAEEVVRVFRPQDVSIDQEAVVFANNFDDLIYWRGANFFRIWSVDRHQVRQIFEFSLPQQSPSYWPQVGHSRYGRLLQKRRRWDFSADLSPSVLYLAYDDDLDLLVLLVVLQTPGAESFLHAEFRESCTGEPFRSTPLLEMTEEEEDLEWTLQADLMYLVLISQRHPNDFCCRVFEMLER